MSDRPRLWIPGPTEVRPDLLRVVAEPVIGHRTPAMRATLRLLDAPLRRLFGAPEGEHRVAVHSATATALMEMALRAVPARRGPRRRVLALVNGSFSDRFARVAESIGAEVVRVRAPFGAAPDLAAAAKELRREGRFDAITVCLSETSSGAWVDAREVADAFRERGEAALLVDAVTHLAAAPVDASALGLDFVFAGTQKALALPPGLGVFAVSEAMLERARGVANRGTFLDLVRIVEAHEAAAPPMTPTVSLVRALAAQLDSIEAGAVEERLTDEGPESLAGLDGWQRRYRRHARMRDVVAAWLDERGLRTLGASLRPSLGPSLGAKTSPTVTCVDVSGRDVPAILARVRAAGFELAPGYGEARAKSLRIGHMGDHSVDELNAVLGALGAALADD